LNYNLLSVLLNKSNGVVDLTDNGEKLKNEGRKKRNEEIKSKQKTKQQKGSKKQSLRSLSCVQMG
jgi:hypothetical protein